MSGWFLLALPAVLLAMLAIPLDLDFSYRRDEDRRYVSCAVGWLFGAIRLHPCPGSRTGRRRHKVGKRHGRARGKSRRLLSMLLAKGFLGRLMRLARDLLRCIHVRQLSLDIRLGLGDPADTGRLWGAVGPLVALPARPAHTHVAIRPDFTAEVFEMECRGRVRIVPLRVLALSLGFLLSPATLRALGTRIP